MSERKVLDCCFILNMDLDLPVSDVHLVQDVINSFSGNIVVIKKGHKENLMIDKNGYINLKSKKISKSNLLGRYINDYKYYKRVQKVVKLNNIQAKSYFIQSSPLAVFIATYLRKHTDGRIIYNSQDLFPDNLIRNNGLKKILFSPFTYLTKKLFRKVDHIITISKNIKDQIISKGIPSSKISVIYNWAKRGNQSNPIINYKNKHLLESKYVVLYAGNIGKFQNVRMILDAAKQIKEKEIVFVIQGDGVKRAELIDYAKSLSLENVLFVPQAPLDTMMDTYRTVDLNLITLDANIYKTALPSKLAFCLNTDVPLIITIEEYSDIRELLKKDELTSFVNPNDIEFFTSKILEFYRNRDKKYYNDRESIINHYFNDMLNPQIYHDIIVNGYHQGDHINAK